MTYSLTELFPDGMQDFWVGQKWIAQADVFLRFRGEGLFGVARDGIKTPCLFTGVHVVGRDVTAHAEFRTAVTDDYFAFDDTRCTGDGVRFAAIDRVDSPH